MSWRCSLYAYNYLTWTWYFSWHPGFCGFEVVTNMGWVWHEAYTRLIEDISNHESLNSDLPFWGITQMWLVYFWPCQGYQNQSSNSMRIGALEHGTSPGEMLRHWVKGIVIFLILWIMKLLTSMLSLVLDLS